MPITDATAVVAISTPSTPALILPSARVSCSLVTADENRHEHERRDDHLQQAHVDAADHPYPGHRALHHRAVEAVHSLRRRAEGRPEQHGNEHVARHRGPGGPAAIEPHQRQDEHRDVSQYCQGHTCSERRNVQRETPVPVRECPLGRSLASAGHLVNAPRPLARRLRQPCQMPRLRSHRPQNGLSATTFRIWCPPMPANVSRRYAACATPWLLVLVLFGTRSPALAQRY